MKKFFYLAVFCLLASASPVSAANYFSLRTATTTPVNDTLRISPNLVGTYCPMFVTANFDGYLDHWFVQITYPSDMDILIQNYGTDMSIPYTGSDGTDSVYTPILTINQWEIPAGTALKSSAFSSTSTANGHWDPEGDGHYAPYGTVKWEPGFHNDMFSFLQKITSETIEGDISISCTLSCSSDLRNIVPADGTFAKTIHFRVAFLRGDANGDDAVNISDVNTITDWLYTGLDGINPYKITAADMDGDGDITVYDVILLIDYISMMNGSNDYDYEPLI